MGKMPRAVSFKPIMMSLTLLFTNFAVAGTTIVQPTGNLIEMWNPKVVNEYLEKWDPNIVPGVTDPFDTNYPVSEIQPTQDLYFVRVYAGPSNNGAVGTYIVRAQFIRGLSPQQIKDVLALPTLPTKIVYVKVPKGAQYGLWTGIAAPINTPAYPFGNGGAQQTKIIGKHVNPAPPADPARFADYTFVPVMDYLNPENLGNAALSYAQTVQHGNAGKIAVYLDHFIPAPYSDMETVYTTLDFVNWMNNTTALTHALNQLSPAPLDSVSTVSFRDNLFFNSILLNHSEGASQNINMGFQAKASPQLKQAGLCNNTWTNVSGEQGEQSQNNAQTGFGYQTAALAFGTDCQIRPNLRVGMGAGYMSSNISWSQSAGSAQFNLAEIGLYSDYTQSSYFVKSALTGGFDWTQTQRNINITGIGYGLAFNGGQAVINGPSDYLSLNRTANSGETGENIGLQILGGKRFAFHRLDIIPTAKIAYYLTQQNSFTETGAESLDLHVNRFNAETLRSELNVEIGKDFISRKNTIVNGNIQLGWAHTIALDNRNITASLNALGGDFTLHGFHEQTNSLLASIGITAKIDKHLWLDGRYHADLSHGFNEQMIGLLFRYSIDA